MGPETRGGGGAEGAHPHLVAAASCFGRLVLKGELAKTPVRGGHVVRLGWAGGGWALWAGRGQGQIWKGRRPESQKRLRLVLINSPLLQCLQF